MRHLKAIILLAAMSVVWTWPLALHVRDHLPGPAGDSFNFLWSLWWMRKALSAPDLSFFRSPYLFAPFGIDLINQPHAALPAFVSATLLAKLSPVEAENIYIFVSVFLNAACAYALAFELTHKPRLSVLAGIAFGGSPYVAAHLLGHVELLAAWVIPLFALFFRRALLTGKLAPAIAAGMCVAVSAYCAYDYLVYIALFAITYTLAWWDFCHISLRRRSDPGAGFSLRLIVVGLIALVVFLIVMIALHGGGTLPSLHNLVLALFMLVVVWMLSRRRLHFVVEKPSAELFWRGIQALTISSAVLAVCGLPLLIEAFRVLAQRRSLDFSLSTASRGVDTLAPLMGNPFHPMFGGLSSALYGMHGLNSVDAVGWLGIVPLFVLATNRGNWLDNGEGRRWKIVLMVFAIFALGPTLTFGGHDLGLPLPHNLVPGRAMVVVYLALGVLMGLRLAALKSQRFAAPMMQWVLVALLAADFLNAPVPLTTLDRPAVYEHLASVADNGAVIEVPFAIGGAMSRRVGNENRRALYYATLHGHPLIGGYIDRPPQAVVAAYEAMPVVGNLLRLSSGGPVVDEATASVLPFRYLVLNTKTASPELVQYLETTLDTDLIAASDGKGLYAVQGAKSPNLRAAIARLREGCCRSGADGSWLR